MIRDLKSPSPISDPGLFWACSLSNRTVCGFRGSEELGRRKNYLLLIPSQSRVLCRGKDFFPKFLEGSARRLKRFLARISIFRAEQASQRFFDQSPSVSMHA